jgi:hypothetical protein
MDSTCNEVKESGKKERGNVPILAAMMLIFLIGAGLAYMKWAADEGVENRYERAATQAHYLAQAGIVERGYVYMRSLEPGMLPSGRIDLQSGDVPGVGQYNNTYILRDIQQGEGNVFRMTTFYDVYSTGVVRFENNEGEDIVVTRTNKLRIRLRSLNAYMYLTDTETTIFGEVIKFWSPDTLFGRVHSNDQIAIMQHPVFYGLVTTCARDFWHGPAYDPEFVNFRPQFNVDAVLVPNEATKLRMCAASSGHTFDGGGIYQYRLVFYPEGGWDVFRWHIGAPFGDTLVAQGSDLFEASFFFFSPLELKGQVRGTVTVGSSEDIRLIDDIWYVDSRPGTGQIDTNTTNVVGIVAEGSVIIGNTPENGRDNQTMGGSSIIINAAILALGESFTFEDQNDVWNEYQGPYPDERGDIHLWGSVVQRRRGYVHRSNHNGSGYGKDYHFDDRFYTIQPPCYPDATDEMGHSLFDIIAWEAQ